MEKQVEALQEVVGQWNPFGGRTAAQMPSNIQVVESIEKLRHVLKEQRQQNPELDVKGHLIASAVEDFLKTSESFIYEKNWDELMQHFAEHVMSFINHAQKEASQKKGELSGKQPELQHNLESLAGNLKRIVQQLFTSTETRTMFREVEGFIESLFDITEQMRKENKKFTQMSTEVKKDLIHKNFALLAKIGSTPASKEMRSDILSLYDYWRSSKTGISQELQDEFGRLFDEAIRILQRFTDRDLQTFQTNFKNLCNEISNDPVASKFFETFREVSDSIVNDPEKAQDEQTFQRSRANFDRGLGILDKYDQRFRELFNEAKQMLSSLQSEKYMGVYRKKLSSVGQSLKGNFLDTATQLHVLLVPILKQSLEEIKLPRIEDSNESASWSLDNITLNGKETNLEDVSLKFKIGLKDLIKVVLKIKHIDAHFRSVHFTYNRTTMPAWSDKGIVDCHFNSPGWKLKWIVHKEQGKEPCFDLAEVKSRIKTMDIDFIESEHSWVNAFLMPLWSASLRWRAQNAIENMLRSKSEPLTQSLNTYFTTGALPMPFSTQSSGSESAASKSSGPSGPSGPSGQSMPSSSSSSAAGTTTQPSRVSVPSTSY